MEGLRSVVILVAVAEVLAIAGTVGTVLGEDKGYDEAHGTLGTGFGTQGSGEEVGSASLPSEATARDPTPRDLSSLTLSISSILAVSLVFTSVASRIGGRTRQTDPRR